MAFIFALTDIFVAMCGLLALIHIAVPRNVARVERNVHLYLIGAVKGKSLAALYLKNAAVVVSTKFAAKIELPYAATVFATRFAALKIAVVTI